MRQDELELVLALVVTATQSTQSWNMSTTSKREGMSLGTAESNVLTHVGQLASNHVTLELVGGAKGGCGVHMLDFVRVLPDGTTGGPANSNGFFRVPDGQVLIVTDVDWQYIHPNGASAVGTIEILRLFIENLADSTKTRRAFESTVTLSSAGSGGISESMTSGFVVSSKARICPDVFPGPEGPPSGLQHLIVRGYLAATDAVAQAQSLFVSSFDGKTITRFDLDEPFSGRIIASGLENVTSLACGPDGRLYAAQNGRGTPTPTNGPRQIVRMRFDGSELATVLDFATTPALAMSGGPEGLSFNPANGELFFNTNPTRNTGLPHTGVWRISGGVPLQVLKSFVSVPGNTGARDTAFLPTGRLVAGADYPTPARIVYRDPPFEGVPQDPIRDFLLPGQLQHTIDIFGTRIPGDQNNPGDFPPDKSLGGLAVNNAGTVLFFASNKRDPVVGHGGAQSPPGTIFMCTLAPSDCNPAPPGGLRVFAMLANYTLGAMAFDRFDNLYVAATTTDGPQILRFRRNENGTHDMFSRHDASGMAVCNVAP
ncbi:hypothetical protein HYR54_15970 [Candidatus Acetothermia bacterium]|nr:hypothetical protein [Candidatus Acetothermia bacterium]